MVGNVEGVGVVTKSNVNLMHLAPRCCARAKRTGLGCRSPSVRGWSVCRMHGARGGAPEGTRNGRYRHGLRSKYDARQMGALAELLRRAKSGVRSSSGLVANSLRASAGHVTGPPAGDVQGVPCSARSSSLRADNGVTNVRVDGLVRRSRGSVLSASFVFAPGALSLRVHLGTGGAPSSHPFGDRLSTSYRTLEVMIPTP